MLIGAVLDYGVTPGEQSLVPVQPLISLIASIAGGADGLICRSGPARRRPEHIDGRAYAESPENLSVNYKTEIRDVLVIAGIGGK